LNTKNIIKQLIDLYHEQRFAHAYLFETNDVDECYNDILFLIKNINCKDEYNDKCSKCNLCNLINNNSLPSLITIEPDPLSIKKEAIEYIKEVFSNKPLYTDNNIYIIKYPEKMNATAFNKLLKFLEEPENGVLAFLITENKDKIASTVVSRCELIKMLYINNKTHNDNLEKIAKDYLKSIQKSVSEGLKFNIMVITREYPEKADIIELLKILLDIFKKNRDFEKANIVVKYLKELDFNVNCSLLLDSFVIEMGNLHEK